jgi:hypothetical protein
MPYGEIIAVCSQIHTKHINTLCGQNVELLNVKPGGTYSDQAPGCTDPVAMVPARRVSLPHSCLQARFAVSSQFMLVTML